MKKDELMEMAEMIAEEQNSIQALSAKWRPYLLNPYSLRAAAMFEACLQMSPSFRFTWVPSAASGDGMFGWWAEHGGEAYGDCISAADVTPKVFRDLILHAYESLKIITKRGREFVGMCRYGAVWEQPAA